MDTNIQTKRMDVEFDQDGIVVVTWRHPKTKRVTGQTMATHIHNYVPNRDLLQRAAEALRRSTSVLAEIERTRGEVHRLASPAMKRSAAAAMAMLRKLVEDGQSALSAIEARLKETT